MTSTGELFSTCSFYSSYVQFVFNVSIDFKYVILNYISKCVNRDKTRSSSDMVFDVGVKFDNFRLVCISNISGIQR